MGVLGVGGIGANVAMMLAAAGIGHLRLIDFDVVAAHNLNRQLAFDSGDIGRPKVEVMCERVGRLAPAVAVEGVHRRLNSSAAAGAAVDDLDVLVVAADEPPDLMSIVFEATGSRGVLAVRGAVGYESGYIGPFVGVDASCWRCFERHRLDRLPTEQSDLASLEGTPGTWSFGPTNVMIASALAHEVLVRAVRGTSQVDAQRLVLGSDPFVISRVDSPECTCDGSKECVVEDRAG